MINNINGKNLKKIFNYYFYNVDGNDLRNCTFRKTTKFCFDEEYMLHIPWF